MKATLSVEQEDDVIRMWHEHRDWTQQRIAGEMGLPWWTVGGLLRARGLTRKLQPRKLSKDQEQAVVDAYVSGLDLRRTATTLNLSYHHTRTILASRGVFPRPIINRISKENALFRIAVCNLRHLGWSMADIGTVFGVSRERIRQISEKALALGNSVTPGEGKS